MQLVEQAGQLGRGLGAEERHERGVGAVVRHDRVDDAAEEGGQGQPGGVRRQSVRVEGTQVRAVARLAAAFASLDNPASSTLTQKQLGWHPVQPALIPDLELGHYFND